jgi:hypothetical protein
MLSSLFFNFYVSQLIQFNLHRSLAENKKNTHQKFLLQISLHSAVKCETNFYSPFILLLLSFYISTVFVSRSSFLFYFWAVKKAKFCVRLVRLHNRVRRSSVERGEYFLISILLNAGFIHL